MPEFFPNISNEELEQWSKYSYPELVFAVARKFIDEEEISCAVLNDIIISCLKRFRIPEVVRIEKLKGGLNIIELFHGTTLAFKDLALSVVGGLIDHYLSKRNKHIIILIGTSGDTGSAAIEGVRGRKGIDIVVLLPDGRCSVIQELQMTTVIEDNVHIYKVEGTSDDLDEPIKQCFGDQKLVSKHNLISINSINWGRIMLQVAHFFFSYYQLCSDVGAPVEIVVPTGAAGNITDSMVVSDTAITTTMKTVYAENKYILCPHTATAVYYHHQRNSDATRGFIATASPAKFPEAVAKADIYPITDGVEHLQDLPTKFLWMRKGEDWHSILCAKIENITKNIDIKV
ncbi:threonine synthase-like 2 isoform X2 [Macrobrachium rosenbergii]